MGGCSPHHDTAGTPLLPEYNTHYNMHTICKDYVKVGVYLMVVFEVLVK